MRVTSFVDAAILHVLLFTFMKAFQDRRAPWYLCGLIRKPLREIGVILLHDVEHCFLGEIVRRLNRGNQAATEECIHAVSEEMEPLRRFSL